MKMKEKPKKENGERWLLTYSDLMNLLLILFIVLYSMSKVDEVKYEELASSLSEALGQEKGVLEGNTSVLDGSGGNSVIDIGLDTSGSNGDSSGGNTTSTPTSAATATPGPTQAADNGQSGYYVGRLVTQKDMEEFHQLVNKILDEMNMETSIGTSMQIRGLTITFKNDVFFDSGSDVLKKDMKDSLKKIARLINQIDNTIVVEGHTDNIPIGSTNQFSSNWQLSAARAANVAQYLAEEGYVDGNRMSAVGYGEFQPIASNATVQGRSKNRRVDIVILYDQPTQE